MLGFIGFWREYPTTVFRPTLWQPLLQWPPLLLGDTLSLQRPLPFLGSGLPSSSSSVTPFPGIQWSFFLLLSDALSWQWSSFLLLSDALSLQQSSSSSVMLSPGSSFPSTSVMSIPGSSLPSSLATPFVGSTLPSNPLFWPQCTFPLSDPLLKWQYG